MDEYEYIEKADGQYVLENTENELVPLQDIFVDMYGEDGEEFSGLDEDHIARKYCLDDRRLEEAQNFFPDDEDSPNSESHNKASDSYVDEGENYDDGRPRLVEEYEKYEIAKPVDDFFELLEIEQKSVEEVAEIKSVSQESVEKAMEFYAEHYEKFDQNYGFELDVAEEKKLPVPDESLDDLVDLLEGPHKKSFEILRDASEDGENGDWPIREVEVLDNGLDARMQEKNGVKGSITVNLIDEDSVRIGYDFSDGEQVLSDQVSAYGSMAVEIALDISFGEYAHLVHENR